MSSAQRLAGRDGPLRADEVRAALAELLEERTAQTRLSTMGAGSDDLGAGRAYLAATVSGGWHVPHWPTPAGGRGADRADTATIGAVLNDFVVPDLYAFAIGLGMVGPALLAHGTETQQDQWLRPIAAGTDIWCQMFSEPDAGSDLANVALRAERDGDQWVLSGQKTWTSRAMWANWAICLARTDPDVPKHRGLTMFAMEIGQPGVEVRPLEQMNGDTHFSEVFVEGARIPDAWRVGEVGGGWAVAMTILAHERAGGGSRGGGDASTTSGALPTWLADLDAAAAMHNPVRRSEAMAVHAHDRAARWTARRAVAESAGGAPSPAGSGAKLRTVRSYKGRAFLSHRSAGASGMLADGPGVLEAITAPSMSIRGGTDEIQRNILGERVLGLPGEPRLDREVAWAQSRLGVL